MWLKVFIPLLIVLVGGLEEELRSPHIQHTLTEADKIDCHGGFRDQSAMRCPKYANYDAKMHRKIVKRNAELAAAKSISKRDTTDNSTMDNSTDNSTSSNSTNNDSMSDRPDGPPPNREPPPTQEEIDAEPFLELPDICSNITWENATRDNNWGNCVNITTDATHRYITSNSVPDSYYNPYCPIGRGYGYCIDLEYELGRCMFPNLTCGQDDSPEILGPGATTLGDVWVPNVNYYKMRLNGNPTQSDRPSDMYSANAVDALKSMGPALAVAINGIPILGPNDAGDISIDEAGLQLACGGHVTPPLALVNTSIFPPGAPAPTAPIYHYHKAPNCLEPFTQDYKGISRGSTPNEHGKLTGWAMDGFGIYTYQDHKGETPIVDECGGHFGSVEEGGEVVYHYHVRVFVPYTIACQGPALGKCKDVQGRTDYCHYGCGAEVCVQPGTDEAKLRSYLSQWNDTWLDSYTMNDFSGVKTLSATLSFVFALAQLLRVLF